jgi:Fibrobacter succinogenes major domain (Fib_succ_major)
MDKEVPVCKTGGFNGRLVQLEDGSVQLCRDKCNGVCPFPQPRPPYVTYIPWFSKYNAKRRFKTKNSGIAFNPGPTAIVDIISPVTGRTWMDRNLGAWQAASGPTDALAYGDLYQYGRRKDGHENRISETSNTQATSNLVPSPNTNKFILNPTVWTNPTPSEYWNETNTGVNDIWPSGYRLPTKEEWETEIAGWGPDKAQSAYDSLKLTLGGMRLGFGTEPPGGTVITAGENGFYHSSTATAGNQILSFSQNSATAFGFSSFGAGISVRLIKIIPFNTNETEVVEIVSPITGRTWMDRNLGSFRTATSPTDELSYGDLYQFGRLKDGHENRSSATTTVQASGYSNGTTDRFITVNNWTTAIYINDLWSEDGGINSTFFPLGFRLPTQQEWQAEVDGWGINKALDAFSSLKLTLGGVRELSGKLSGVNSLGMYHSCSAETGVLCLTFDNVTATTTDNNQFSGGRTVRLIKIPAPPPRPVNSVLWSGGSGDGRVLAQGDPDPAWLMTMLSDVPVFQSPLVGTPGWITHPNVLPGQHRIQQQVDFTGFNKTTALFRMTLNGREIVEDVLINGVSAGFDLTMLGFGNLDQLYTVNNSLFNNNVNTLEFLYRNVTQTTFTAKIHFSISVTPL